MLDLPPSLPCSLNRPLPQAVLTFMAERVGFEPTVGVNPLRFSRPVH
jgi:hypothetical protein